MLKTKYATRTKPVSAKPKQKREQAGYKLKTTNIPLNPRTNNPAQLNPKPKKVVKKAVGKQSNIKIK